MRNYKILKITGNLISYFESDICPKHGPAQKFSALNKNRILIEFKAISEKSCWLFFLEGI
jgi:hypothetical protein